MSREYLNHDWDELSKRCRICGLTDKDIAATNPCPGNQYQHPPEFDRDEIKEHDRAKLDEAINLLMRHFDTVQIFCTRVENGMTLSENNGDGNWYARFGQVVDWVDRGGKSNDDHDD